MQLHQLSNTPKADIVIKEADAPFLIEIQADGGRVRLKLEEIRFLLKVCKIRED